MSTIILGYARTPFTRFTGALGQVPATELGAHAIRAALTSAGIAPADVQQTIAGQVLQGGAGQNPARQSAVGAGIPLSSPAVTINAVCLSGMEAVVAAHRLIAAGECDVVVAVGQESMSLAPHAMVGSRRGTKYGQIGLIDTVEHDGLTDAFENRSMGLATDERNGVLGIGRAAQDAWAAGSHSKLAAAVESGVFDGEIAPLANPKDPQHPFAVDDGLRVDTTVDGLARLRAAFSADGTITAGNSSQITDGAAALVLVSESWAAQRGLVGIAKLVSHAFVSGPDLTLHSQPSNAIRAALAKTGSASGAFGERAVTAADLAAVEINEAFASVVVQSIEDLGVDPDIVNPHGGAIALGHPIGASGARIVGHLARTLAAVGPGALGAAGICGGGGQGSAVVLESL